jgi:hypothetical protein
MVKLSSYRTLSLPSPSPYSPRLALRHVALRHVALFCLLRFFATVLAITFATAFAIAFAIASASSALAQTPVPLSIATISIPSRTTTIGDTIALPVIFRVNRITPAFDDTVAWCRLRLRWNPTVLSFRSDLLLPFNPQFTNPPTPSNPPNPATPFPFARPIVEARADGVLAIRVPLPRPLVAQRDLALISLPFVVGLGDANTTTIDFDASLLDSLAREISSAVLPDPRTATSIITVSDAPPHKLVNIFPWELAMSVVPQPFTPVGGEIDLRLFPDGNPGTAPRLPLPPLPAVSLIIHDLAGRVIVDVGSRRNIGATLSASAEDSIQLLPAEAARLLAGVYYCRFSVGTSVLTKPIIILR